MPWSTIIYQRHWFEMRHSRLVDLFNFLAEISGAYISKHPNQADLAWLQAAGEDWKKECELPPGCIIIELDKYVFDRERQESFYEFVGYAASLLLTKTEPDPMLASEAEKVRRLVKNLDGQPWIEGPSLPVISPEKNRLRMEPEKIRKRIFFSRILISLLVVGISTMGLFFIFWIQPKPDKMGPKSFTRFKLLRIESRILEYYDDKGVWPNTNSWFEELSPYFAKERSFRPDELVADVWGRKIKYAIKQSPNGPVRFLYSFGPNKIDDVGSNDDLVLEIYDPKKPKEK